MIKKVVISVLFLSAWFAADAKYVEPRDTSTVSREGWNEVSQPLQFGWVAKDEHYRQFASPKVDFSVSDTTVRCWRGERLGVEALVAATETYRNLEVRLEGAGWGSASFMRYVMTTAYNTCGYPSDTLPTYTVPDMIDLPGSKADVEAKSVRPVWVTLEVPRDAAPGNYKFRLVLEADGKQVAALNLTADVLQRTLPAPEDYAFYLDLWQQPYAVSRYYGVEPWSEAHLKHFEPYVKMMARAGQKAVSVILFYEPWGEQSNDKFLPMVQTTRKKNGKWEYDYSVLDRYVEFMGANGVNGDIECFTMIPWDMEFRYFDEKTGKDEVLKTTTDSPEYKELWTSFLQSLQKHAEKKGWSDRLLVVMDERGLNQILDAKKIAREAVPGLRMSLAGNYHGALADELDVYTLLIGDWFPASVLQNRRAKGYKTLMYTCCANTDPNLFSNSQPAEAAYIAPYATATGWDGYLHWSFTNWTDNPLEDTRFHMFAPGDTYFVYPDGRSSIRYERFVEGVQQSEKMRMLRDEFVRTGDVTNLEKLNVLLLPLTSGARVKQVPASQIVNDLTEGLNQF